MIFELTHNDQCLTLKEASELEIEQLKLSFCKTIANAKWDPRVKKGWWDGKINFFKSERYLPSGFWYELIEISKEYNFEIIIKGIERKFDHEINKEEFEKWVQNKWSNSSKKPRDYQIESAYQILRYKNCLSELATSSGKTLISYMVMSYLLETNKSNKILMIVPTVGLVIQSTEDFYEYNEESVKLNLKIQQIFAGSIIKEGSNIVVGTYQSLVKKDAAYFESFDCIVVDECHAAKSNSIKSILEKCYKAERRFGLSGTIPKSGTLDKLTLMAYTGPVINTIRADYLMEKGHITPCEVHSIEMNYASNDVREGFKILQQRSEEDRKKILNLEQNFAIQSEIRLEFITDIILKNNKNSLVLFYRTEYGNKLYDKLRQKTDRRVLYIDGSVNKDIRELHKETLEEGNGKILIASYGTFSTGISVDNIHVVYLTESFKSEILIRQSIGRGLRKHNEKKKLIVIDFVDDYRIGKFNNYLFKHGLVRREIYKEQNFPFTVRSIDLNKIYTKN